MHLPRAKKVYVPRGRHVTILHAQTVYDGMINEQQGMYTRRYRPLAPGEGTVKDSHEVRGDARPVQTS